MSLRSRSVGGALATLATALVVGCSSTDRPVDRSADSPGSSAAGSPTVPDCSPAPLRQRAAAVLMVGLPEVTSAEDPLIEELTDLGVGGVFLAGYNIVDLPQVQALVSGLRERSPRPLLVSTDEESGRVSLTRPIVGWGPSPRELAATSTAPEVREFAAKLGTQLAEIGVDLDLAPSLDLDDGPYDGVIGDRSFSAEPGTATRYGLAFSRGLTDAGVAPAVKHFPGQGRSATDTHTDAGVVDASVDELRESDLVPFQRAVDAGAPVVMLNHLGYSDLGADLPASLNPAAYELLREMRFEGVAMTDSLGMGAVNLRWGFPEAAVRSIEAGADLALATDGRQARVMRDAIVRAVRSGRLPEARLDEAAARVTALAGGDAVAMSCLDP